MSVWLRKGIVVGVWLELAEGDTDQTEVRPREPQFPKFNAFVCFAWTDRNKERKALFFRDAHRFVAWVVPCLSCDGLVFKHHSHVRGVASLGAAEHVLVAGG